MSEITILGTGAMAMYIGGRLAKAGIEVSLLGTWRDCIQAVNQQGICIVEGDCPSYFPAKAYTDLQQLADTHLALVLVKSWQTARAASQLRDILAGEGLALTLQNGLGNGEILQAALGLERTAAGVTTYGATVLGPGKVKAGGEGVISLQDHPRLLPVSALLKEAGFDVQYTADLTGMVWGKLVVNVAINPLTALLGVRNGKLLESPAVTELMSMAAREAAEVADQLGVPLNFTDPAQTAKRVASATSENLSSMLQDIQRGAPTEIDAVCGAVVRQGAKLAVPTPVNELLWKMIRGKVDLKGNEV